MGGSNRKREGKNDKGNTVGQLKVRTTREDTWKPNAVEDFHYLYMYEGDLNAVDK